MFEKLQRAFWKALTPDLIPDQPKAPRANGNVLNDAMLAALGGSANIKSQQPLALTRPVSYTHLTLPTILLV